MPATTPNNSAPEPLNGRWMGDIILGHCRHPLTFSLLDLWNQKRGGNPHPQRRDLDVLDLRPWLGWLAIYDYLPDRDDYFCRLFGEHVRRTIGTDMTGRHMSEYPPDLYAAIRSQYDDVRRTGRPLLAHFMSSAVVVGEFQRARFPAEKLILPLSRSGTQLDCFLTLSLAI